MKTKKKKGLHSNLVRFLVQNYEKAKKRSLPTVFVLKPSAQVTKDGPCRNFAYYFMLIILSWRPKAGAMAQWPTLNTPLLIPYPWAPKFHGLFAYHEDAGDGNNLCIASCYHIFVLRNKEKNYEISLEENFCGNDTQIKHYFYQTLIYSKKFSVIRGCLGFKFFSCFLGGI